MIFQSRESVSNPLKKELILKALQKCNWNQTHAAGYLDISRKTLLYRIEKHNTETSRNIQLLLNRSSAALLDILRQIRAQNSIKVEAFVHLTHLD
ncbi:MAG: helix-turn-helix domain-containing protein [Acidobacteriaceae bacterium]|nr:helix-turn-helix domain-containing protein [Acidobacteriaceae bacterium]MBV9763573.1 helix-turn-helix domain-containing protein [Acidobacteriaceae bacterium]